MFPTTPPKLRGELGLRVAPVVGIGAVIDGKYRVESIVGRGGMGVVVAAREEPEGRRVAVKLLSRDPSDSPSFIRRALREARAAAALQSEHATRVLHVGQLDSGLPYIVMELLDGQDFERLLAKQGSLSVREVATYLVQACDAIIEAHARGIVHRDLKPSNLFLTTRSDGAPFVKLMDFGISKVLRAEADTSLTNTHDSPGTPRYMSPEQLLSARQVDSRTDVWALGVIAFRMLAGRHPFDGETPAAVHIAIASNPAPRLRNQLPDLPLPIAWLVERCLVKSCNDRLQTASEFATVLLAYADEETQRRYAYLREGGPSLPAVAFSTVGNGSVRTRGRTARRRVQHVAVAGTIALIAASGLLLWSHHLATRLVGNPIAAGEMGSARPPAASENPAGESPVAPSPAPSFAPVVSTSAAATRSAPPTVRHDAKSMTHPKAQPVEPTARDPYAGRR